MITLPRKARPTPAARAVAFQAELAPTESLFGRWSRFCLHYPRSHEEVTKDFAPASGNAHILPSQQTESEWRQSQAVGGAIRLPRGNRARAAELMGLSSETVFTSGSLRLCSPTSQHVAMSEDIRACWACMALGFHSMLFQHYALRTCPLHGAPVTTRCPGCGKGSSPTFRSVATNPFGCSRCGELWLRTAKPAYGDRYLGTAGTMLADRLGDIFQLVVSTDEPTVDQADARALLNSPRYLESACHGRHVARWTAWPSLPSARWPAFVERRLVLFDWSPEPGGAWPGGGPLSSHDATACLQMLIDACAQAGHASDSVMLKSKLTMSPRGLRINDNASIVSVALHLTLCTYGRHAPEAQIGLGLGGSCGYYSDIVWNGLQVGRRLLNSDSGNAQLLVAEILAWFAACIVEVARMKNLEEIDWGGELGKTLFLPSWVVTRSGKHHVLRARERSSERKMARLLRRYPPEAKLREHRYSSLHERRVGATPDRVGYLHRR